MSSRWADYGNDPAAVARHLRWPEAKVRAALNYEAVSWDWIDRTVKLRR
jgi:hypothetical protein